MSNKMSGCLRGGAGFYNSFRTLSSEPPYSVFISYFIILWFATLWGVRPYLLRGRLGASGIVLYRLYTLYIYIYMLGSGMASLVLGACFGALLVVVVLMLLRYCCF